MRSRGRGRSQNSAALSQRSNTSFRTLALGGCAAHTIVVAGLAQQSRPLGAGTASAGVLSSRPKRNLVYWLVDCPRLSVVMAGVRPRIDELSRGGKNNRVPLLTGVHHVAVPTTDPLAGSDWYVRVFDFAALLIEERESEVVAVLLQHPCGVRLLLRRTAAPLAALREYPLFGLTVASYTELQHWVEHLTTFDVEHSAVHQAQRGWAVTVTGPDLVRIQLQTDEGPSGEDE